MEAATQVKTVQGKFGFYPCEWETYRKLKRLNFLSLEHRKVFKRHERWELKLPHNRIQRKWTRNEAGQKISCVPGEPITEPRKGCDELNGFVKEGMFGLIPIRKIIFDDYRKARYPQAKAEFVVPLKLSEQKIDQLLEVTEKWYAAQ